MNLSWEWLLSSGQHACNNCSPILTDDWWSESPVCLTELYLNSSQPQNCSGILTELLWLCVQMFINSFSPGWGSQCLLLLCAADRQGFGECRCARASFKMAFKWSWTCSTRKLSQWEAPPPQGTPRCKLTGYLPLFHSTCSTSTGGLKAPSLKRISATKPFADCFSNSPLSIT